MGSSDFGAARNAATRESESTRYLPSLTDEIAYITTKNASSSVTRSPYGIAHASWLTCSSCRLRRAIAALPQIAAQLGLDAARVVAPGDAEQPVEDQVALHAGALNDVLQLVADRQEDQVRRGDAVDRRDERGRDAAAELRRLGQVVHHRDQAHHGADDAERRGVDAEALEDSRPLAVELLAARQLDLEDVPDRFGLGAVDEQLHALAQEVVRLLLDDRLEREQPVAARDVAPFEDLLQQALAVAVGRHEDPAQDPEAVQERLQADLDQHGGERADDHDHERGAVPQGADSAALQHAAADHGNETEHDTDDAEDVHPYPPLPVTLRAPGRRITPPTSPERGPRRATMPRAACRHRRSARFRRRR